MAKLIFKSLLLNFLLLFIIIKPALSEIIKEIEITGNKRVSDETIIMFSTISVNEDIDYNGVNDVLKKLFESNFFKDVVVNFKDNILKINVIENPIIQNINYDGIKAKKIKDIIIKNLNLKPKYSYNENLLKRDKDIIQDTLKDLGYYFSTVDVFVENLSDNTLNLTYKIDIGKKAKIKKIKFIGKKIFKEKKLKSIIISEEYKFWKLISGKKFLNQNTISFDTRLLKNFYLNKGYYDVEINSSFAKLISNDEFELIFNINAKDKFVFNDLNLELPKDFDKSNFKSLLTLFDKLKGDNYSINKVEKILDQIDKITIRDQFEFTKSSVIESIDGQNINLTFVIEESKKIFVEKINIYGNNVTMENVIRNKLEIDEGDPFNEILSNKSINNLKSLNFFKNVKSQIIEGSSSDLKIINIKVEEKPTGELSAGAGVGTSGGTVSFGVKENNYLGKGVSVLSNLTVNQESIKGLLSVTNPNFRNTDKSVYFTGQTSETDRLEESGYKTNRTGISYGTNFEYLNNFKIGLGNSNYYEKIETSGTASTRQKAQDGNYWDSFLNLNFDYDTRNQKFQTTEGIRSRYFLDIPMISETATVTNSYNLKLFSELYENNISIFSLFLRTSNSLKGKDIKLSERIILPSNKLRGFQRGKVGPKDGDDYIGGNYAAAVNFTTSIPQILENSENIDFLMFLDAANIWSVDYFNGDDEGSHVRSSIGVGIDWITPVGPLNFTLSQALSKSSTDKTETFRFNLGTTF